MAVVSGFSVILLVEMYTNSLLASLLRPPRTVEASTVDELLDLMHATGVYSVNAVHIAAQSSRCRHSPHDVHA